MRWEAGSEALQAVQPWDSQGVPQPRSQRVLVQAVLLPQLLPQLLLLLPRLLPQMLLLLLRMLPQMLLLTLPLLLLPRLLPLPQ